MNKDDKEKEPIKIDIENLEDLSEEEIINLINELTSKEVENKKKPNTFKDKIKHLSLEFIKKIIIDFILIFTINFFIGSIESSFLNFIIYFLIFNFIDFSFNKYITYKFPLVTIISFGLVNSIITYLSFIVTGIICLQFMEIVFSKFIICSVAVIIFIVIKKFVIKYFLKLRKKGSKNVSSKWFNFKTYIWFFK